jgi:hypothetical protein
MTTTYAAVSDVQALINTEWFTIGVSSVPSTAQVQAWLNQYATHVDAAAGLASETSNARDLLLINPYLSGRVAWEVWHVVSTKKEVPARVQAWLTAWEKWIEALTSGDQRLPSVSGSTGRARIIPTKVYGLDT